MINKNNNRFIKAMNDSAVMISKEAQMEAPGAESSDPCVKRMQGAKDINALFDAFESCAAVRISEDKVETKVKAEIVMSLTAIITAFIKPAMRIFAEAFGTVLSSEAAANPYSLFWELLCGVNGKDVMYSLMTRLIQIIKKFPNLLNGPMQQMINGLADCFAAAFSWSNAPGLKEFFKYLLDPAISARDMDPSRKLLNSLCAEYAAAVRIVGSTGEELERRAKRLYDLIVEFLGVLGGGLAVVNAKAIAVLNAVMSWIGSHPGETLTIAAIIAIAAALVFGTGGLGAPAVPEVAAAIIAIAAALGITNDYSEDQIVEMLNQANNG